MASLTRLISLKGDFMFKLNFAFAMAAALVLSFTAAAADSGSAMASPPFTDAQIASVLRVVNKAEAESGQLAQKKAENPEVKQFASQMVVDHQRADQKVEKLMTQLKIKPQEFTTAQEMRVAAEQSKAKLEQLNGADFDKAFLESQISMHQDVLKTIDTQLLPSAKSAAVKTMVQEMRPKIAAHLRHAEALQTKLQ